MGKCNNTTQDKTLRLEKVWQYNIGQNFVSMEEVWQYSVGQNFMRLEKAWQYKKSTELDESGNCSNSKSLPTQKKTEMLFSEQKHSLHFEWDEPEKNGGLIISRHLAGE